MDVLPKVMFCSLNINGISEATKLSHAIDSCLKLSSGSKIICCLQECKVDQLNHLHLKILEYYKLKHVYTPAERHAGGLLMAFSTDLDIKLLKESKHVQCFEMSHTLKIYNFYCRTDEWKISSQSLSNILCNYVALLVRAKLKKFCCVVILILSRIEQIHQVKRFYVMIHGFTCIGF